MSGFSPTAKPKKYDVSVLSEGEKTRFASALGDEFGYSHREQHLDELALPATPHWAARGH